MPQGIRPYDVALALASQPVDVLKDLRATLEERRKGFTGGQTLPNASQTTASERFNTALLHQANRWPFDNGRLSLPVWTAQALQACVDTQGYLAVDQVETHFGKDALALIDAATKSSAQQLVGKRLRAFELQLQRYAPDFLSQHAEAQGVPNAMPVLQKCVERLAGQKPLLGMRAVLIQHQLGQQIPMFDAFEAAGLNPKDTAVVGRGYSDSALVKTLGRERGYCVYDNPNASVGNYEEAQKPMLRNALMRAVRKSLKDHKPILLLDDGGLATRMVNEELREFAHLFRCVEQTSRGITELKKSEATQPLRTPVINVARSQGKATEAPAISRAVLKRLHFDLDQVGHASVEGRNVVLMGYGLIGKAMADDLCARGAHVTVIEKDPHVRAQLQARIDAGEVAVKSVHAALVDCVDASGTVPANIVIGCTGHPSLDANNLLLLASGSVLASCSSAEVEIDTAFLARSAQVLVQAKRGDDTTNHQHLRCNLFGRHITVLAEGKPINFDGGINSVEPNDIQLTAALMFVAAIQAAGSTDAGIVDLAPEPQQAILADMQALEAEERRTSATAKVQSLPVLQLPKDTSPTEPKLIDAGMHPWDFAEVLSQHPSTVRGLRVLAVNNYPGLEGASLIACGEAMAALTGLAADERIVDIVKADPLPTLLVSTRDSLGRERLHIVDEPPFVVGVDGALSLYAATPRLTVHDPAGCSLVQGQKPAGSGTGASFFRTGLLHWHGNEPHILDLGDGTSGVLEGLPKLDPSARLMMVRGVIIDLTAQRFYGLSSDLRRVIHTQSFEEIWPQAAKPMSASQLTMAVQSSGQVFWQGTPQQSSQPYDVRPSWVQLPNGAELPPKYARNTVLVEEYEGQGSLGASPYPQAPNTDEGAREFATAHLHPRVLQTLVDGAQPLTLDRLCNQRGFWISGPPTFERSMFTVTTVGDVASVDADTFMQALAHLSYRIEHGKPSHEGVAFARNLMTDAKRPGYERVGGISGCAAMLERLAWMIACDEFVRDHLGTQADGHVQDDFLRENGMFMQHYGGPLSQRLFLADAVAYILNNALSVDHAAHLGRTLYEHARATREVPELHQAWQDICVALEAKHQTYAVRYAQDIRAILNKAHP